jgi:hypothetical protein
LNGSTSSTTHGGQANGGSKDLTRTEEGCIILP